MSLRASNIASVQLEIDGAENLGVFRFSGREALSDLYRFTVDLLAPVPLSGVFRRGALLRLMGGVPGEGRCVHGIVHALGELGDDRGGRLQRVEIVPRVALLQHRRDCRIFQKMTVEQICRRVLTSAGLAANTMRFILCRAHTPREYCVQYRESDWDFIRRLLAEDGCHFYFEHCETEHTMVVNDDPQACAPLPGGETLWVADRSAGMLADADHVTEFWSEETLGPGVFSARDYNYLEPSDTLDSHVGGGAQDLEVYDYPGHYTTASGGHAVAQARLAALQVPLRRARGRSSCARLAPGYAIVANHRLCDEGVIAGRLRVLEVIHTGEQPQALGGEGAGKPSSYMNEFVCMPADSPVRAPCPTKPAIHGPQTAVVTGPDGEEIFTDELGRIKVQFHWDRQGKYDDASSCWVRVSQAWAGSAWGALRIPRVGHEVVVAFLDGNPDRPLVIGSVYHAVHATPFPLPEHRTRSGVRSESSPGGGGHNELAFEDNKGAEEVYLHAQKDLRVAVEHDAERSVGHDETRSVGNDRTTRIGHNEVAVIGNIRTKSVGADETVHVGANQSEQIGAHRSVQVGGNDSETIGASKSVTIGMASAETVALASAETVGLAKTLTIGAAYVITVGASMTQSVALAQTETVGTTKVVTVGDKISITCGASVLTMDKDGQIQISGKDITVTASGAVNVSAKGDVNVESAANVNVKGSRIHMN